MNATAADEYSILLVDDDPLIIATFGSILQAYGRIRFAQTGAEALALAQQLPHPDLVLLDIELPDISGFEVCSSLKASVELRDIPVIFISGHSGVEQEMTCLQLGAAGFISKPPHPTQVAARVAMQLRVHKLNKALREAAGTDPLTELANRRRFDETLEREGLRATRSGAPLSLLMLDVDFFKRYNDRNGHVAGDECLRRIARILSRVVRRPADVLARYGGEEFAILLPDTPASGACCVARTALQEMRLAKLPHFHAEPDGYVTVSVGVSTFDLLEVRAPLEQQARPRFSAVELVAAADRALYASKAHGRNHARYLSLGDRGAPERASALPENP